MNDLARGQSSIIRQISKTRAEQKAVYRFLNNEAVTEKELIAGCCERTAMLCKGKHVLLINDTTEANLNNHRERLTAGSGIGVVGNNSDIGFFAHLGLAIDMESCQALGFSSIQLWHRAEDKDSKGKYNYQQLPIEEKESFKWIQCGYDGKENLKEAASVTLVGDRESDIYELLCDIPDQRTHLIIRNRFNRQTVEGKHLHDLLNETKMAGSYTIELNGDARKGTKKRKATINVKFREVWITKPDQKSPKNERPGQIKAWIVEAREKGKTDGICWRLITTYEVRTFEEAIKIIELYQMRWWIEEVFRLLKSKGFRIEDSELESGWAIRKLTIMVFYCKAF